jgi:dihydrofolate reductase
MGILTVTAFTSVDGVMQAPGGAREDTAGGFALGGWVRPLFDEQLGAFMGETFSRAQAFLLGRGTYELFAPHWSRVSGDPVADALNALPKFIASRTLSQVDWAHSELVPDAIGEISAIKAMFDGEVQVHGSAGLARGLLAAGVVDALNLIVFPVVLGAGKRLFHADSAPAGLQLISSTTTSTGVIIARYRLAGEVLRADMPSPP